MGHKLSSLNITVFTKTKISSAVSGVTHTWWLCCTSAASQHMTHFPGCFNSIFLLWIQLGRVWNHRECTQPEQVAMDIGQRIAEYRSSAPRFCVRRSWITDAESGLQGKASTDRSPATLMKSAVAVHFFSQSWNDSWAALFYSNIFFKEKLAFFFRGMHHDQTCLLDS